MQIEKKSTFTLISLNEGSFSNFFTSFLKQENKLEKENIVVQISDSINTSINDFLLFLSIAKKKKDNGTSFVLINTTIDIDNFPEEFNIVPTLQEAEDIIEMESIERELGF